MTTARELPRPPKRCTPSRFYTSYLPELWSILTEGLTLPPQALSVQFEVGDPTPYHLSYANGELTGHEGPAAQPILTVRCNREAWELAVYDIVPRVIRRTNQRMEQVLQDIERAAAREHGLNLDPIAALPGTVTIDFTDDAGDRGVFELAIGAGSGPAATVVSGDADLWALLDSGGQIVSLLKSRAQLEGDVGYLFRLAHALEGTEEES